MNSVWQEPKETSWAQILSKFFKIEAHRLTKEEIAPYLIAK